MLTIRCHRIRTTTNYMKLDETIIVEIDPDQPASNIA